MTFWQAVISGVVQGATEFLPVSSSGHLIILHHLLKIRQDFVFDIFVHLGTLLALLAFFRKDIIALFCRKKKLLFLLILASIPTAIIGFLGGDIFARLFVNVRRVGAMLLITGIWLLAGDIASRCNKTPPLKELVGSIPVDKKQEKRPSAFFALLIGFAQGIALIPGISRSGSTISTGLICGLSKESAFKFSFLLSIPAVSGALLFKIRDFRLGWNFDLIVGMLISAIVGFFCLKFLLHLIKKGRFYVFAIYCFVVGIGVLML